MEMRVILITNYFYPWNCSGTMRWLQFGRYINFDVLTSKKPRKAFYDSTLPKVLGRRVYRHYSNLPAVLFGVFITFHAIFFRYDLYIVTVPPFTLSFCAWILQKMGRKVVLDVRDNQDNKNNRWKLVTKMCSYFNSKIKHRTTCMQFMDPEATRILSGYNPELGMKYTEDWDFYELQRTEYRDHNYQIAYGVISDYRKRINGVYYCSSFVNLLYLGFKGLPTDCIHEECLNQPVQSWEESAKEMQTYLERVYVEKIISNKS